MRNIEEVGYMKRNQIYSFKALHDVMAVYDREFGISFPRIRPMLESWDLRKSHDNKCVMLAHRSIHLAVAPSQPKHP